MPNHAEGSFDVTITPQASAADATVARMLLYKEFHGDLEAIAHGEMLAASEPHTGARVYFALDRVTGTLHGRSGSFCLRLMSWVSCSGDLVMIRFLLGC